MKENKYGLRKEKIVEIKESKYEKVLKLSDDELIANAIKDILKREELDDAYKK